MSRRSPGDHLPRPEILYQEPHTFRDLHDPLRLPYCWKRVHALYGIQPRCHPGVERDLYLHSAVHDLDPDRVGIGCDLINISASGHPTIGWKFLRQIKKRCFCSKKDIWTRNTLVSLVQMSFLFFVCIYTFCSLLYFIFVYIIIYNRFSVHIWMFHVKHYL